MQILSFISVASPSFCIILTSEQTLSINACVSWYKTIRWSQFLSSLLAPYFIRQILMPSSYVHLLQLFSIHVASCSLSALGGECVLCRELNHL